MIGYAVIEPGQIAIPGITAALKVPAPLYAAAGAGIVGCARGSPRAIARARAARARSQARRG